MKTIRLATRGSDLALAQTRAVARLLREAHPELEVVESIIRTSGDRDKEADLSKSSSPGLFTKELEAALLDHRADAAVHSLKDLPTVLPEGLALAAVLPRADSADVLVSMRPGGLAGLSAGSRVGTGSPRRQAMLLAARHDLAVLPIRGNVPTRLAKLAAGQYDAIILAAAGLVRRHGHRGCRPARRGDRCRRTGRARGPAGLGRRVPHGSRRQGAIRGR
jgi:hydroxymethylbilane synthase